MKFAMHIADGEMIKLTDLPADFAVIFRQKGGSLELRASHICIDLKGITKARQEAFLSDLEQIYRQYKSGNQS